MPPSASTSKYQALIASFYSKFEISSQPIEKQHVKNAKDFFGVILFL